MKQKKEARKAEKQKSRKRNTESRKSQKKRKAKKQTQRSREAGTAEKQESKQNLNFIKKGKAQRNSRPKNTPMGKKWFPQLTSSSIASTSCWHKGLSWSLDQNIPSEWWCFSKSTVPQNPIAPSCSGSRMAFLSKDDPSWHRQTASHALLMLFTLHSSSSPSRSPPFSKFLP